MKLQLFQTRSFLHESLNFAKKNKRSNLILKPPLDIFLQSSFTQYPIEIKTLGGYKEDALELTFTVYFFWQNLKIPERMIWFEKVATSMIG